MDERHNPKRPSIGQGVIDKSMFHRSCGPFGTELAHDARPYACVDADVELQVIEAIEPTDLLAIDQPALGRGRALACLS